MYRVELKRSAVKDLKRLPKNVVIRISAKIDELAIEPYPSGSVKLKGVSDPLWRIRVGHYRIVYAVEDTVRIVEIRRIQHRKDVYKD